MKKNILKIVAGIIVIMTFGWMGTLLLNRYFTPMLMKSNFFSRTGILDTENKNTTIINKTEKVVVGEDSSATEIASGAVYAVADVYSFLPEEKKTLAKVSGEEAVKKYAQGKKGTGTILTNDGIIVTHKNNIIEEGADYKIMTFDGAVLDASLLGVDEFTELAFLKADGANLTTIPFADSDDVNSGRKVIALGGLTGDKKISLADGVLTELDENFNLSGAEVASSEKLEGVFRMNFSGGENYVGGPVISYSGELLAISSAIKIDNEINYFQIPANAVRDAMQKAVENRLEESANLGIYYISVNPYYKNLKGLTVDKGALVYSASGKQGLAVVAGSAAEKSGIKINDIIVSIDGNEINSSHPLSDFINQYEKGSTATMNVLRAGESMEITVEF